MKSALLTGKGRLEIIDGPRPRPRADEVLVRVHYCGICGSDVHIFRQGRPEPLVLGHEFSGEIAELGSKVEGWQPGQRVAVLPGAPCGQCAWCAQGQPQLCQFSLPPKGYGLGERAGALAEYIAVSASSLHRLPPGLASREAALAEPLSVVLHAVGLSRFRAGHRVLVLGCGTIGLLTVLVLSLSGAGLIMASDPMASKRQKALSLGAGQAHHPAELSFEFIQEQVGPTGPEVIFECVGVGQSLNAAFACAPKG
ncbi:MAG: alcohol dehydrogenase catalytic domain-containing protein, partial [Deltaproteobacteria bacterium]|nr:alcohol dehydrogenase catalytic domain-containing protein [Deltaproteobacteria bacterium]